MSKSTVLGVAAAAVALVATLTACGDKQNEQFNDAPRTAAQNNAAAEVISMPDGFSNVASKCDGPDMVYVIFHNDSAYGSLAGVANDPRCTGAATTTGPATHP